jgi:hypothetical protein
MVLKGRGLLHVPARGVALSSWAADHSSLRSNCTTIMANGFGYQNCSGVYYQPQYGGSSVTYVVVNRP